MCLYRRAAAGNGPGVDQSRRVDDNRCCILADKARWARPLETIGNLPDRFYTSAMLRKSLSALCWAAVVAAHGDHDDQKPVTGPLNSLWYNTLPGDGGTQVSQSRSTVSGSMRW